jgi:hypothetical protein
MKKSAVPQRMIIAHEPQHKHISIRNNGAEATKQKKFSLLLFF